MLQQQQHCASFSACAAQYKLGSVCAPLCKLFIVRGTQCNLQLVQHACCTVQVVQRVRHTVQVVHCAAQCAAQCKLFSVRRTVQVGEKSWGFCCVTNTRLLPQLPGLTDKKIKINLVMMIWMNSWKLEVMMIVAMIVAMTVPFKLTLFNR